MVKSKNPEIERVRKKLARVKGVKAAIVIGEKGNLLGSGIPHFAQAAAEWMGHAEVTAEDVYVERPDKVILVTKSERIIVMRVNAKILLATRTKIETNQLLVSLEILRAAEAIKELMKQRRRKKGKEKKMNRRTWLIAAIAWAINPKKEMLPVLGA